MVDLMLHSMEVKFVGGGGGGGGWVMCKPIFISNPTQLRLC